jgi:hypothetical protein
MDNVIETLMVGCGALSVAPQKPFPTVQDFQAHILQRYGAAGEAEKGKQLEWVLQAVRAAEEGKVAAVVQCIKNVAALS